MWFKKFFKQLKQKNNQNSGQKTQTSNLVTSKKSTNFNNNQQGNLPPLSALDKGLKQKLLWQSTSFKVLDDGTVVKTHIPVYRGNPFSIDEL